MKIMIDDQYQNDEDKQYTVDENGNVNLFISVGDEVGSESSINEDVNLDNNNIKNGEKENFSQNNLDEFEESILLENNKFEKTQALENEEKDEICECSTANNENLWEEENFPKNYHNLYTEIENKLEEKYAFNNDLEEKYIYNDNIEKGYSNISNNRVNKECSIENEVNNFYQERERAPKKIIREKSGVIEVFSRLGNKEGIELKGARINLYLLNGISPKLYDSKFTDSAGKVTFSNLPNGCYRIIAIVDRRFFEKPNYYNWNEVIIDKNNKNSSVLVVNRIKAAYYRR